MASTDVLAVTVDVRMRADPYELGATIALCGSIEGTAVPSLPANPVPAAWNMIFDSPVIGDFENKWQLWQSPGGRYAIVIRGTISEKPTSVLEDLMAVMIPATGCIELAGGGKLPYSFASDPAAAVHLGFAIGALLLLLNGTNGILVKAAAIVPAGADVIITGHSQGAAIATLIRAFLHHMPGKIAGATLPLARTYLWAQPKPGNDHFARDFELIPEAYRITNSLDWVPQLPLTLQLLASLNTPNPLSVLPGEVVVTFFESAINTLARHLENLHLAKFIPQVRLFDASIYPPAAASIIPGAPGPQGLAGGLNFEAAGIPLTLEGRPGVNPADPSDSAWQHHAAMYASLLADSA